MPYRAMPDSTKPDPTSTSPEQTISNRTRPYLTSQEPALPLPQGSLMNLKLGNIEATKAGAIIANAYRLSSMIQNILKQVVMDLVIVAKHHSV